MNQLLFALNIFVEKEYNPMRNIDGRIVGTHVDTTINWFAIIPFIILLSAFVITIIVFLIRVYVLGSTYKVSAGGVSVRVMKGSPVTPYTMDKLNQKLTSAYFTSYLQCRGWYKDPSLTKKFVPGQVYNRDIVLFPLI